MADALLAMILFLRLLNDGRESGVGFHLAKKGLFVKQWYKGLAKGQKIFVYFVSTALVLIYGTGLIPLAVLIYLELGERGAENQ